MSKLRQRLSFANVVSVISLLFALGLGSAWAATELSKNEVKSKHIKNQGVKTKDLAKRAVKTKNLAGGAVKGNKVAEGSLLGEHFAQGELPAGAQGEPGPQGERGLPGQDGADGSPDTPNQVLSKLTEVDGAGSGLNADLLDGRDSKGFARYGGRINTNGSTAEGEGFASTRNSLGTYTISFPAGSFLESGVCRPPSAVVTPFTGELRIPRITAVTCSGDGAASFTVEITDADAPGAKLDTGFMFIAF